MRRVGLAPGEIVVALLEVRGREIWIVMQDVVVELAPAQLGAKNLDVSRRGRSFAARMLDCVPELERADLAESEMRRHP